MFDRRSFLSAGAATSAALAAPARAFAQSSEQVVALKFAMKGPQPVTTCFIGGQGPYIMLIDTGDAVGFVLKREIIDKLNLRQTGFGRLYGASGTNSAEAFLAHDVVFGQSVRQPEVTFVASEKPGPVDGIIPLSLITARPTEMDFSTGEVRLHLSGGLDHAGFRAIRCERVRTQAGAFIAQVMVEGQSARLIVDTGAGTTVSLDAAFVRRHGLWEQHAKYVERSFRGVTGSEASSREVRTPELKIGDFRFKDVVISLTDPKLTTLSDADGLLGIEMLRRFTLGFDAGGSTLWLKPNDALSDPFIYDHAGLRLKLVDGMAQVQQVSPGGPAEQAGFKVGDRLREVDTAQKLGGLEGRFYRGPLDSPLTLAVVRDGQRMPIRITPQDWL